jgi:hypothetical protein
MFVRILQRHEIKQSISDISRIIINSILLYNFTRNSAPPRERPTLWKPLSHVVLQRKVHNTWSAILKQRRSKRSNNTLTVSNWRCNGAPAFQSVFTADRSSKTAQQELTNWALPCTQLDLHWSYCSAGTCEGHRSDHSASSALTRPSVPFGVQLEHSTSWPRAKVRTLNTQQHDVVPRHEKITHEAQVLRTLYLSWRVRSSGFQRHVVRKEPHFSEEHIVFIFRKSTPSTKPTEAGGKLSWMNWVKPRKFSGMVAGVLAEIENENLPNKSEALPLCYPTRWDDFTTQETAIRNIWRCVRATNVRTPVTSGHWRHFSGVG